MSRKRKTGKRLLGLLKLLVFSALMVWVIGRVQFRDSARPGGKKEDAPRYWGTLQLQGGDKGLFLDKEGKVLLHLEKEVLPGPRGSKKVLWKEMGTGKAWRVRLGFIHRVTHMNIPLLLLAALAYFLCASFAAVRWHWLLRANGLAVSLWEAWRLNWVGVFFNNVVPGLTGGDVVKAYYIAKHTGKKTVPILTVVVDRILGLTALALLALLVVLANFGRFRELAMGILGLLGAIVLFSVPFLSRRVRRGLRLSAFLRKLPGAGFLMQLDEALTFYRNKKIALFLWILASMGNHVLSTGFVAVLGCAMGYNVSWVDYFVLVPVINIASAVPLAPAGWGVGETLYDLAFMRFSHLGPGEGAALSAVSRVLVTGWSLLGGILLLTMKDRVSHKVIEEEMEEEMEEEIREEVAPAQGE